MIGRVKRNAAPFFATTLILADTVLVGLAFYLGYLLRLTIEWFRNSKNGV